MPKFVTVNISETIGASVHIRALSFVYLIFASEWHGITTNAVPDELDLNLQGQTS